VVFKAAQYRILSLSVTEAKGSYSDHILNIPPENPSLSIATETLVHFSTGHKRVDNGFGCEHYQKTGEILPDAAIEELKDFDAIYLGTIGHPDIEPRFLKSLSTGKMGYSTSEVGDLVAEAIRNVWQ
jgi:hypothetical protein